MTKPPAFLLFVLLLFNAAFPVTAATEAYVCPMRCEKSKAYSDPGRCPVCGMDLVKLTENKAGPLNSRDYRVDIVLDRKPIAGNPVNANFSVRKTKDNKPVTEIEGPVRVVLVAQDLSWSTVEAAKQEGPGHYRVGTTFPFAGNFIYYVELIPKGERKQVFPLAVQAEGQKRTERPLKEDGKSKSVAGFEAKLVPTKLKADKPAKLSYQFFRNGKRVKDVHPVGAVIVSEDTTHFLEVHPANEKEPTFHTVFPRPGLYKSWARFRQGSTLVVVDFVLRVRG